MKFSMAKKTDTPLKSKYLFKQMFGLWYSKEARWKMGNNKKIPAIIRIMIAEKFIKMF